MKGSEDLRRLRVGLNATCFDDRPSGARQRFVGIYGSLFRQSPDIDFIIFEPSDIPVAKWFEGTENVQARRTPVPSSGRAQRVIQGLLYWGPALRRGSLDLFEGFHLPFVAHPSCLNLLTIHDLRPLLARNFSIERLIYRRVLDAALDRVAHVIAVSETVVRELTAFAPQASATRIYNGIDLEKFAPPPGSELEQLRTRFGLPAEFMLAVGHLEPRKNYPNLLRAMALMKQSGPLMSLVIVGNESGERAALDAIVSKHGLSGRVLILSNLSDTDVRGLYRLCSLVVFPSVYEGFGIPILEAMASGKAVVLSNIPVFEEITEGRGCYFDPLSPASIAEALTRVLQSDQERERLIHYGTERVKAFAFPQLAASVRKLYDTTLSDRKSSVRGDSLNPR